MTALSVSNNTVIQPPAYEMNDAEEKKFFYDLWARTGGYNTDIPITFVGKIDATSTGTAPTVLSEFIIPADAFRVELVLEVQAYGTFAANANNKSVILYFGDDIIIQTATGSYNAKSWNIMATIIPLDTNLQSVGANLISDDPGIGSYSKVTTHTLDTSLPISINVVGTGVSDGDVTQYGMLMKWSRKK